MGQKVTALTTEEQTRLTACTKIIKNGLKTFVDVGNALMEVRDNRLYRAKYSTFEDYCQEEFDFGRRQASFLINSVKITFSLGTIVPKPTHESQTRPLAQLAEDRRIEAWNKAVELNSGNVPTAAQVQTVVDQILGKSEPSVPTRQNGQNPDPVDRWNEIENSKRAYLVSDVTHAIYLPGFDDAYEAFKYLKLHPMIIRASPFEGFTLHEKRAHFDPYTLTDLPAEPEPEQTAPTSAPAAEDWSSRIYTMGWYAVDFLNKVVRGPFKWITDAEKQYTGPRMGYYLGSKIIGWQHGHLSGYTLDVVETLWDTDLIQPETPLTPAAVDTLATLADQEPNPEAFAAQAAAIITEDLAATDGLPGFVDQVDPVTGEVSRVPVGAVPDVASDQTPQADPTPTPAPDWKSIIDVDKFYGIDMHDRKVFTRGYAVQHQADMAYPRAPGQTNLRILIGSKLLAFLMPGQMYDHYQPYPSVPAPTSTPFTPAAPIVPFDFDPLGVYLYNPLEKQLYTDQFPSVVSAQRDERADARWFPETGAIITRNWQRRFADYTLMTLAERSAKTAPLTSIKDAISQPYTDTPRSQWEAGKADAVELVTDYALLPSVQVDLKDSKGFRFEGYTIAGTIAPERALSTYGDQEWTQLRKFQDSFNFMMKAEMTRRLQAAAQPASAVQPV